jgi:hypothetical protein
MEVLITRIELTDDYTQAPKVAKGKEEVQDTAKDGVEKKTAHAKDSEQGEESSEVQDDASPQDTSYDKSTAVNSDKAKSKVENAQETDTNQIVEQRSEDAPDEQNSEDEGDVERQPVSALGEAKAIIEDLMDTSNAFICVKKSKNVKRPVKRVSQGAFFYNPIAYEYPLTSFPFIGLQLCC